MIKNKSLGLLILYLVILYAKIVIYYFFATEISAYMGGGNDSEYYDAYALGYNDNAVNIWPVLLRELNFVGLYSRDGVSLFFLFLNLFILPYLFFKIVYTGNKYLKKRIFFTCFIFINIYPTLFYLTFDIYRDVFMVFIFLLGLWALKTYLYVTSKALKSFWFIVLLWVTVLLYFLRPYLGFGFLCAIFSGYFFDFKRNSIWFYFMIFFAVLQFAFYIGYLDPVIKYRQSFESVNVGGSNLGISFTSSSLFIFSFFKSILYQLFGVFFVNFFAVILFFIESTPFYFCLFYILKNRKYSSNIINHFMVFFASYSTIWILGNDNLGTATRLRIFSYIVIYAAFFIIYQNKNLNTRLEDK